MDREMAREAIDAGAELEPALPVRQADRRTAASLWRGFRLDPCDRTGVRRRRRRVPHRRPTETVGLARWRQRHAALVVDLDEGRRVARPSAGVARPAARPEPGDA